MSLGMAEAISAPAAAVARTNSGIACAIILHCFHTNQRFIHGIPGISASHFGDFSLTRRFQVQSLEFVQR